jgi:predicted ATPase
MTHIPASIRTPDQLLRVFVSSTLNDLVEERRAVRASIERLRLAPVMFELGARPHPPRDLYRSYLQRSEIFLGIYWQRYGWIAPNETISGLEDEYNLAPPSMPRLIYIKTSEEEIEPRLAGLIQRIMDDDRASFKMFDTVDELAELVEADLATLLADRFDAANIAENNAAAIGPSAQLDSSPNGPQVPAIPTPLTNLLGRSNELENVTRLITQDGARLVTLTGSGGIGKSRLALELATSLSDHFADGVAFVPLAAVQESAQVAIAIAAALGVQDTGSDPILETLITALQDRTMLIVADNFEQVLDATPAVTLLLAALPKLSMLVTSRTVLRVLGEQRIEVGPLALPRHDSIEPSTALESPAVQLFVQRARSVAPEFDVTEDNVEAVVGVCRLLDGVPLALELAAASIRLLPPAAMLSRLRSHHPLAAATRNLPDRQRSLRDTIEWSVQLLDEHEKLLLYQLGVFSGGFSLAAAEAVVDAGGDVLNGLGALVDSSLIRQQDHGDHAFFSLLRSVQQFAREGLEASGLLSATQAAHARYYTDQAREFASALRGREQNTIVLALSEERDNLRAVVRYLIDNREWDRFTGFIWDLYVYWWVGGLLNEVRGWMNEMLESGDALSPSSRAIGLYYTRAITFWDESGGGVLPGLTESADLFHTAANPSGEALTRASVALAFLAESPPNPEAAGDELERALTLARSAGDTWSETLVLVTLGRVAILEQKFHRALNRFEESLDVARRHGDDLSAAIALNHLGWAHLMLGDVNTARAEFQESLHASWVAKHAEGMAYGLEGMVAIAAADSDVEQAAVLLGASTILRERTGLYNVPTFSFHQQAIAPFLTGDGAPAFAAARARGRALPTSDAIELALQPTVSEEAGIDDIAAPERADRAEVTQR